MMRLCTLNNGLKDKSKQAQLLLYVTHNYSILLLAV